MLPPVYSGFANVVYFANGVYYVPVVGLAGVDYVVPVRPGSVAGFATPCEAYMLCE